MVDWSKLLTDILYVIAKRLDNHFDFLHFRSVCRSWRASVPSNLRPRPTFCSLLHQGIEKTREKYPFKMRAEKKNKYSIYKNTVCLFTFPPDHGQTTNPRFWFVCLEEVDDGSGKTRLIHPLLWRKLQPGEKSEVLNISKVLDISNFHVQEVRRLYVRAKYIDYCVGEWPVAYMNVNANSDEEDHCIVLGIDNERGFLNFHKSRDEESIKIKVEGFDYCGDCIQYRRKFYVVEFWGKTVCVDPCSGASFMLERASIARYADKIFVELCGNLLLVEFQEKCEATLSFRFEVFLLDEERRRWNRLESLGDGILFLGGYANFNFSAPVIPGVKGNCIVFNHTRCFVKGVYGKKLDEELFVYNLSSGRTIPLSRRPDLLQLFRPPFHN